MINTYKQNYIQRILLVLSLFLLFTPILVFAEIQWGVVPYNINVSGGGSQTQPAPFGHTINIATPSNSNLAINAIIKTEPGWFPSSGNELTFYFYISKDTNLDLDNTSPDWPILSVPVSNTTKEFRSFFRVYQDSVNDIKIEKINTNGTSEIMSRTILNQGLQISTSAPFLNLNDQSQGAYVCASYGSEIEQIKEVKLGCTFLKKNIINQDAPPDNDNNNPPPPGGGGTNPAPPTEGTEGGTMQFDKLKNPLCATTGDSTVCSSPIESVTEFIERILNIVIMIGMPIVVLALIWAGFLYVKAQGNSEKIKEAHKTLLWTVVGAGLLMGSWAIANAIKQTVVDIGTGAGISKVYSNDNKNIV